MPRKKDKEEFVPPDEMVKAIERTNYASGQEAVELAKIIAKTNKSETEENRVWGFENYLDVTLQGKESVISEHQDEH